MAISKLKCIVLHCANLLENCKEIIPSFTFENLTHFRIYLFTYLKFQASKRLVLDSNPRPNERNQALHYYVSLSSTSFPVHCFFYFIKTAEPLVTIFTEHLKATIKQSLEVVEYYIKRKSANLEMERWRQIMIVIFPYLQCIRLSGRFPTFQNPSCFSFIIILYFDQKYFSLILAT